jgi:hypothetical protein
MSKEILGSKYFSAAARSRMETLLPALNRFVAPTQAITSFEEISRQLNQAADAMEKEPVEGAAPTAPGAPDLSGMSNEELLKKLQ